MPDWNEIISSLLLSSLFPLHRVTNRNRIFFFLVGQITKKRYRTSKKKLFACLKFFEKNKKNSQPLLHLTRRTLAVQPITSPDFMLRKKEHVGMDASCLLFCYSRINQSEVPPIIIQRFWCNQKFRVKLR